MYRRMDSQTLVLFNNEIYGWYKNGSEKDVWSDSFYCEKSEVVELLFMWIITKKKFWCLYFFVFDHEMLLQYLQMIINSLFSENDVSCC